MPFVTLSIKDIKTISGSVIKFLFRMSFMLTPEIPPPTLGIKLFINKSTATAQAEPATTTSTSMFGYFDKTLKSAKILFSLGAFFNGLHKENAINCRHSIDFCA